MERVKVEQRLFLGGFAFFFDVTILPFFPSFFPSETAKELRQKHFSRVSKTGTESMETNLPFAWRGAHAVPTRENRRKDVARENMIYKCANGNTPRIKYAIRETGESGIDVCVFGRRRAFSLSLSFARSSSILDTFCFALKDETLFSRSCAHDNVYFLSRAKIMVSRKAETRGAATGAMRRNDYGENFLTATFTWTDG